MPGSKRDRKNGKQGAGVAAAVTKHANKPFGKESPKGSSASPSPPQAQTPSSNGLAGTSPLLDAISATSFTTGTSPSMKEWPKGVPAAVAGSPGNLISLMGESPPTQPSSYEDPRAIPYGWPSPRPRPSASPPRPARRPLSFQMDGYYSPPDPHGHVPATATAAAAAAAARRSSMHSHVTHARASPNNNNPPLPHQPQPHFYGLPDIDFDLRPLSGMKAGDRGYHFGFDCLPCPHAGQAPGKDSLVLAGYEGGLEVHAVGRRGLDHVASLKGLRGGVFYAKVLPWASPASDLFPLVAVVVHGPAFPPPAAAAHSDGDYDAVSTDRSEAISHHPDAGVARDGVAGAAGGPGAKASSSSPGFIESYQTSVEVYSLRTNKLVEVLLEAPRIPLKTPITSPVFTPPPPSGAFNIKADAGNLVVTSGVTGECWLYRQVVTPHPEKRVQVQFVCVGKLWTTLQHPPRGGDVAPEADATSSASIPLQAARQRAQSPIVALGGRWLAYCPATPSSHISLRASVRSPVSSKAPGLSSLTSPQLPPVNSDVDLPMSDGVMNKIMRDATQELIQSARWVGKQGLQAWNKYWNPQSAAPQPPPPRSPPLHGNAAAAAQGWASVLPQRQEQPAAHHQFPPTHGTVTPPVARDPGLVSILDMESVGLVPSLHPISTFQPPYGCSFLSLAPSGLLLFTASSKGDVQTVWDLMRVQYTKASTLQPSILGSGSSSSNGGASSSSRIRQVSQFSRMTVARIVDVAWTKPNGERAAMVTERGTVHLLDLPSAAFTWPPPRRRARPQDELGGGSNGGGGSGSGDGGGSGGGIGGGGGGLEGTSSAVSMASNAFSSVRDAARPLMSRPRRSSSNVPQTAGASLANHASHGGKVIAASISHSLGKTGTAINQLRHTGENRVSLPAASAPFSPPGPGCVAWITGRRDHYLFALGDGLVRTFPTKSRRTSSHGNHRQRSSRLVRYRDFKLPSLPDDVIAPSVRAYTDPDEYLDLDNRDLDQDGGGGGGGGNINHHLMAAFDRPRLLLPTEDLGAEASIPQAEIESNAPYQPFHTDRRVGLFEYSEDSSDAVPALTELFATTSLQEDDGKPRRKRRQQSNQPQQPLETRPSGPSSRAQGAAAPWVFGQPIRAVKLDLDLPPPEDDELFTVASGESRALPASAMERVLQHHVGAHDGDQIVVTTRRRRGAGRSAADQDDDGFFEDDCEVLDFADQRV